MKSAEVNSVTFVPTLAYKSCDPTYNLFILRGFYRGKEVTLCGYF